MPRLFCHSDSAFGDLQSLRTAPSKPGTLIRHYAPGAGSIEPILLLTRFSSITSFKNRTANKTEARCDDMRPRDLVPWRRERLRRCGCMVHGFTCVDVITALFIAQIEFALASLCLSDIS